MDIDKISELISLQKSTIDKASQNEMKKGPEKTGKDHVNETTNKTRSGREVQISQVAKKLQESESILRNALEHLKELDEKIKPELEDIKHKINNKHYDNDYIEEIIAARIFTDEKILNSLQNIKERNQLVSKIKDLDSEDREIDSEKLALIKKRIENGFYNNPELNEKIAENILDLV